MLSASKKEQTSLGRCSTVRWKRKAQKSVTCWTLCSAEMEALLQECSDLAQSSPTQHWQQHRLEGSQGHLANPFPAALGRHWLHQVLNISSVSVTAKTKVQPKCCPEHLSGWIICIWAFWFGPFQVSLEHPFSAGPAEGTLGEQKRL